MSHDTFESLLIEKSKTVFGFQGSYADRKKDEYENIKINSMEFIGSMKSLSENKGGYQEYFRTNYNEMKNFKLEDLSIYDVVVTGKTEDLQSLQGAPYSKAAVRGVTVEKY
ncbi:anti sigma factor C-terminal domain-containing protein [Bacillus hominis]|uniref:Anti sigma factor C-terminal domain-containing protein n=1 Tax=Bacillus hominis TaxID=2817478 RepID=A0ABT7RCX7_9BACI|nr:anti sigma factor C-terminal domain-containing protein [Bacillus hominis]MDM5195650.1 anti sigma factor C-terminal domain-containing protein [Bacillus hominis]MDM5435310.1 anti sigma factor C-terminal domain-containing protein [Bacillus hominis]MDM5440760.1 anti sigma factor C-terminal domain-containing protein [Bacillus hominis]